LGIEAIEALEEEFGVTVRAASQALATRCGLVESSQNYRNREKYREFLILTVF
jgi:hypothetical protein